MFNFFDSDKNPFMVMMNHMAASAPDTEKTDADAGDVDAMRFMQQAFTLQMQIARTMFLMPFTMMQGVAEMFDGRQETEAPAQDGFRLGKVALPPELLQMALQIDMKPENLEKLQKALDFVFSALPEPDSDGE